MRTAEDAIAATLRDNPPQLLVIDENFSLDGRMLKGSEAITTIRENERNQG